MELKGAEIRNILELCMDIGAKAKVPLKINIPFYQRPYKWEEKQITTLIDDFYKNKIENSQLEYFVGAVVLVQDPKSNGERLDVIDGQQRLTSIFLLNYLGYLLQRAYTEELISLKKSSTISEALRKLEEFYKNLFGCKYVDKFERIQKEISEKLEMVDSSEKPDEIELLYKQMLEIYREELQLETKNLTDINKFLLLNESKQKNFIKDDELAITYSRESYNEVMIEALAQIYVVVSKDQNPIIKNCYTGSDKNIQRYIAAIECQFNKINELLEQVTVDNSLKYTSKMISFIDEMINNIKFCVIITGNEKDAYTLFEVLNDRALKIDDLDLIKNLFLKSYCNKSGDLNDKINENIELLDNVWGEKIFNVDLSISSSKLISYLGAVYLTGDDSIVFKETQRYREAIEKYYLNQYSIEDKKYKFIKAFNDVGVFWMIRVLISEYKMDFRSKSQAWIDAECDVRKSITYKTFHMLNALKLEGVMPALVNVIIKKYFIKYVGDKTLDIDGFRDYIKKIAEDYKHSEEEFKDIHNWAFEIWTTAIRAKDYSIPREIAKKIIKSVSVDKEYVDDLCVSTDYKAELIRQFAAWISSWQYRAGSQESLKIKILFIVLFMTEKTNKFLRFNPTVNAFNTDEIQLDHMEAAKPNGTAAEKYFTPSDAKENREKYINSLGNIIILDSKNNNDKNNKPLTEALEYYNAMSPNHWLIKEVEELLQDGEYIKNIMIDGKEFKIPSEKFFTERSDRLRRYFEKLLERNLRDEEMHL